MGLKNVVTCDAFFLQHLAELTGKGVILIGLDNQRLRLKLDVGHIVGELLLINDFGLRNGCHHSFFFHLSNLLKITHSCSS